MTTLATRPTPALKRSPLARLWLRLTHLAGPMVRWVMLSFVLLLALATAGWTVWLAGEYLVEEATFVPYFNMSGMLSIRCWLLAMLILIFGTDIRRNALPIAITTIAYIIIVTVVLTIDAAFVRAFWTLYLPVLGVIALILTLAYLFHARRTWMLLLAMFLVILAMGMAYLNADYVATFRVLIEVPEESAAATSEATPEQGGLAGGVRFAEDDAGDLVDVAGQKSDTEKNEYELAAEGKIPATTEEEAIPLWKRQGPQRRDPTRVTTEDEALTNVAESSESEEASLAPEYKQVTIERIDTANQINLFAVKGVLLLAVVLLMLDYMRRSVRPFGAIMPLPLRFRFFNYFDEHPRLMLMNRQDYSGLKRYLEDAARKGESFIYMGPEDPWGDGELLPRLAFGPLALTRIRKIRYDSERQEIDSGFIFESAWYDNYCFTLTHEPQAREVFLEIVEALELRTIPHASAKRTVHIVWDYETPIDQQLIENLLVYAERVNLRILLMLDDPDMHPLAESALVYTGPAGWPSRYGKVKPRRMDEYDPQDPPTRFLPDVDGRTLKHQRWEQADVNAATAIIEVETELVPDEDEVDIDQEMAGDQDGYMPEGESLIAELDPADMDAPVTMTEEPRPVPPPLPVKTEIGAEDLVPAAESSAFIQNEPPIDKEDGSTIADLIEADRGQYIEDGSTIHSEDETGSEADAEAPYLEDTVETVVTGDDRKTEILHPSGEWMAVGSSVVDPGVSDGDDAAPAGGGDWLDDLYSALDDADEAESDELFEREADEKTRKPAKVSELHSGLTTAVDVDDVMRKSGLADDEEARIGEISPEAAALLKAAEERFSKHQEDQAKSKSTDVEDEEDVDDIVMEPVENEPVRVAPSRRVKPAAVVEEADDDEPVDVAEPDEDDEVLETAESDEQAPPPVPTQVREPEQLSEAVTLPGDEAMLPAAEADEESRVFASLSAEDESGVVGVANSAEDSSVLSTAESATDGSSIAGFADSADQAGGPVHAAELESDPIAEHARQASAAVIEPHIEPRALLEKVMVGRLQGDRVTFRCVYCTVKLASKLKRVGRRLSCPKCHNRILIPAPRTLGDESSSRETRSAQVSSPPARRESRKPVSQSGSASSSASAPSAPTASPSASSTEAPRQQPRPRRRPGQRVKPNEPGAVIRPMGSETIAGMRAPLSDRISQAPPKGLLVSSDPEKMVVRCPACNQKMALRTDWAGRVMACPKCAASFQVPRPK